MLSPIFPNARMKPLESNFKSLPGLAYFRCTVASTYYAYALYDHILACLKAITRFRSFVMAERYSKSYRQPYWIKQWKALLLTSRKWQNVVQCMSVFKTSFCTWHLTTNTTKESWYYYFYASLCSCPSHIQIYYC